MHINFTATLSFTINLVKGTRAHRNQLYRTLRRAGLIRSGTSLYHGSLNEIEFRRLMDTLRELCVNYSPERFVARVLNPQTQSWVDAVSFPSSAE